MNKLLKSRLAFKKTANFTGKFLKNFQDVFETRKGSFISASWFCIIVALNTKAYSIAKKKKTDDFKAFENTYFVFPDSSF